MTCEVKPKHAGGRPRYVSLSPEEMEKLGKEMVKWCLEEDPIHLSQWYTIVKGITYNQWKSFIQCQEFLPYYEQAIKIVGYKYLKKDSPIEPSLKHRWMRVYFKDLKEEEDEALKSEYELKSKVQSNINESVSAGFDALMSQIGARQSDKSDLKMAESKSKPDTKS